MTSIDWFNNQIHKKQYGDYPNITYENIFKKAKEMHKAEQEILYTEEQVREAYIHAYMLEADADERENAIKSANYFIKSLKQPKKD